MRNIKVAICTIVYLILYGCANVQPPTGGPVDETPPKIVQQTPQQNEINFREQHMEIVFDEAINLQNIQNNLMITPLTEIEYEAHVRRNVLTLDFEEPFEENTTYTFNFREAIRDVTENNVAENLQFAFSTGPYLDSIIVEGTVKDLLTNQPLPDINVSLYHAGDTNDITNSRPVYLSKTDNNGRYRITNIKNGHYDIYALEDESNNMLYEKESERIAFKKNLDLNVNQSGVNLSVAKFITTPPNISSTTSIDNNIRIVFDRGLESLELTLLEDTAHTLYYNPGEEGKTFTLYNTVQHDDSLDLGVVATDSSLNVLRDTVRVAFDTRTKKLKEEVIRNIKPTNNKLNPNEPFIEILFSKPVVSVLHDSINLSIDTLDIPIDNQQYSFNQYRNILIFDNIESFRDSIILELHAQSFINVTGDTSASRQAKFTPYNGDELGLISGRVETEDENFILELLNTRHQVITRVINATTFNFPFLEPGQYQLRYIQDLNANQRWDSGNLLEQRQPEPVIFYRETINVRANWEIRDIVFDVSAKKGQ
ncbi:Ig-like domain-containing protein [Cytophagaceae bacterium ABcell3]|nr:Ig-like domain-containing protein [Cytophagaceae bacterium ABcell3]